ncbi:capsular biosynthesis protein [Enterobacterales bacterium CwR94]|nr:capsular biosynthesis protein [Enterobacterales bacterium CwR94]
MTDVKQTPSLAVIIPVYNVLDYVQEAVDSILNQSQLPAEVIIVNDGSTDGSGDLVEKLYGQHPRVKIVHTPNGGLGEARNVGTRVATADFIYYFDSDDISVNGLIAAFNTAWQKSTDLDIYAFSADSFNDPLTHKADGVQHKLMSYRREMETVFSSGEEAFNVFCRRGNFIPNAWLYIYRRDVQVNNQLWFLPIIHEDEEFTPRLFFAAKKVVVTNEIFFRRRVRMGSIMQSGRGEKNAIGYLRACEALEGLMVSCRKKESLATLNNRIIENLVLIMSIRKKAAKPFTAKSDIDLDNLKKRHRSFELWLANNTLFCWRVMNFARKQMRSRVSA